MILTVVIVVPIHVMDQNVVSHFLMHLVWNCHLEVIIQTARYVYNSFSRIKFSSDLSTQCSSTLLTNIISFCFHLQDPSLRALTLSIDGVYSGLEPEFAVDAILTLECDKNYVLYVPISKSIINRSETVMVTDNADCRIHVRYDYGSIFAVNHPWKIQYIFYHGDQASVEADNIVIVKVDTGAPNQNQTVRLKRIPECYFGKLSGHIDFATIYTNTEPENKTVTWLMNDDYGHSRCEDTFFIERYALVVMAANINSGMENIVDREDQCKWSIVSCKGRSVAGLSSNVDVRKFEIESCSSVKS